jgi:hypothetical protein
MQSEKRQLLERSNARLADMAERIGQFLSGSEDVFLRAGERLVELEQHARDLLDNATQTIAAGTGEASASAAAQLGTQLSRASEHIATVDARTVACIDALRRAHGKTLELTHLRSSFSMIASTLRSLASSTQIESARMKLRNASFETVAVDVRLMIGVIAPVFDDILTRSTEMGKDLQLTMEGSRRLHAQQTRDRSRLESGARTSLRLLEQMVIAAERLVTRAATQAQDFRRQIGEAQVAMQSHDLSRQILEHVDAAVHEYIGEAAQALAKDDADFALWMTELAEVSRLLEAQVSGAQEKLSVGLRSIDQTFQAMAAAIRDLAQEASALMGKSGGGSLADEVERGIARLASELRTRSADERQVSQSLQRAVQEVRSVEERVAEVARIGGDARIVGLNAMVKASNAGRDGTTFTVLARAIQDVADTIETTSSTVIEIMTAIAGQAHGLAQADGADGADDSQVAGDLIVADLERLVQELRDSHQVVADQVLAVRARSTLLSETVQAISTQIAGMLDRTQLLVRLRSELDALAGEADKHAVKGGPRRTVLASRIQQRYTMADERITHAGALGSGALEKSKGSSDASTGTVEFF